MRLIHGEALTEMRKLALEGVQVDAVICDPPYGTTACKWDNVIPFGLMWELIGELLVDGGACALFCAQPFTSKLIVSNIAQFKHTLVWQKSRKCNFAQAPYMHLLEHEDIALFSTGGLSENAKTRMSYYPQGLKRVDRRARGVGSSPHRPSKKKQADYVQEWTNYPSSILRFDSPASSVHPTQKPVDLMEYLVRTYTQPGETVLDFTMGSGSTGVACVKSGRSFIGIEQDAKYFKIAQQRIRNTTLPLF